MSGQTQAVVTDIPARMDRLPWCRVHVLIIAALGITWILDGLEVTLVGSIAPLLQDHRTLGLTTAQIGETASCYVIGAVIGALGFGWLTDRAGRRLVFNLTLLVYLVGVIASATAWNFPAFALGRILTGLAIGGEYSAINSAIDELIPARLRGRVDLMVNGSYWLGAAAGAALSLLLADGALIRIDLGWRLGFALGGVLAIFILLLRRFVPESPRWLITHGRAEEAARTIADIEARVIHATGAPLSPPDWTLTLHPRRSFGIGVVLRAMATQYRSRAVLVLVLMAAQAFLYNAIFFTYGLVLTRFDKVAVTQVGLFILPLAAGNFLGPLLLGPLFDIIGRRRMIAGTYAISGLLLLVTAAAFASGMLTASTQTAAWSAIFFFASAAASAAYLTASEVFPLETRGLAIALFYAAGTAVGGVIAPTIFSVLIAGGRGSLAAGYVAASLFMLIAAGVEIALGIDAEGQSLERISAPLSA
jgi:MFS family permease